MSKQSFKQYLGWGLVGTPSGRQYSNDGIDKQFNLAKNVFELAQDLGGCLPSPTSGNKEPLYALIFREFDNTSILGFASYYSIFEQGQNRAGTYFGSFVETVDSIFTLSSLAEVWNTLSELNAYQAKHFIDFATMSYKTNNISNQPFDTPISLDKIQLQALPSNLLGNTKAADFLFIHCKSGESSKVAEKIISIGLYRQFRNIFFTESEYISNQMRQMKRLQISSAQLFSLDVFVSPYKSEIHYLHAYIQELSKKYQDAENEIQRLNKERDQIIQQEVQKNVEIQARAYQQQRDNAISEMKKVQAKAELGNTQLALFSSDVSQEIASRVASEIDRGIKQLKVSLQSQPQPPRNMLDEETEINSNSSTNTLVWMIISALLFLMLLGNVAWQYFSESVEDHKGTTEYKQLLESSNKLKTSEEKVKSLTEKEKQQDEELNKLKNQVRQLCSAVDKKQKRDFGCE